MNMSATTIVSVGGKLVKLRVYATPRQEAVPVSIFKKGVSTGTVYVAVDEEE